MNYPYFFLFLSIGVLSYTTTQAQNFLSLDESLEIALNRNFNIRIAQEDQRIGENDFTLGNAGLLPSIFVDGAYNASSVNTQQQFLDGRTQNVSGANSNNRSIGINLNWTIFNGYNRFSLYKQLGLEKDRRGLDLRLQIELTIASVITTYYDIVQNEQALAVLKENLQVSRERLRVAKDRYELGAFSKIDYLRAQVDFNLDSASVINQTQTIVETKIALNQILNRAPEENFAVADSILLGEEIDYTALKEQLKSQNTNILVQRKALEIAQQEVAFQKGYKLPQLDLVSRYSYFKSTSDAGFVVSNRNYGPSYGLRLSYNLFNGSNERRIFTNTQIEVRKSEEEVQNIRVEVNANFELAYRDYLRNKQLYELETYNAEVAQQNLEIAIETYKLGGLSTLDFRDIQQQALTAMNRLIGIQYNIKAAEIEMLRISGELIKNQTN